jgi:PEGA domain
MRVSVHWILRLALGVAFAVLISRPASSSTSRSSASHGTHSSGPVARADRSGGSHGGGGFHGGGVRVFGGWGGWGWYSPWWWGYGYYPYPYPYPYRYAALSRWTAVKTDVEPDEAALYLDGKLIGTADDFDGYPDKLYLGRGHYRLEFRLDGYESYTTEVEAEPGLSFRVNEHLKKIPGAKHHGTYEPARPEGGVVRFFRKRGDRLETASPNSPGMDARPRERRPEPYPEDSEEMAPEDEAPEAPSEEPPSSSPALSDSRLSFEVDPEESAVYVDGRFAGGARELNSMSEGFAVEAGEHRITVTCPGYRETTVEVMAPARRSARVRVRLRK